MSAQKQVNLYFHNRLILVSSIASIVLNIILWGLLAGKFGWSQERIPLHFNVVYGIDFVDKAINVYQLPGSGLFIFVVNAALGRMIFPLQKLFSYFLSLTSVAAELILFIAAIGLLIANA